MTQNISRRTILPALVATAAATGVGAANASPTPASLISLETIEKAQGLIRDRLALVDFVRGIGGGDRLNISVAKKKKENRKDNSNFFASTFFDNANLTLNDGYDPDFNAIHGAIRNAAIAQLRRVEVKLTALGIDFESDGGDAAA